MLGMGVRVLFLNVGSSAWTIRERNSRVIKVVAAVMGRPETLAEGADADAKPDADGSADLPRNQPFSPVPVTWRS